MFLRAPCYYKTYFLFCSVPFFMYFLWDKLQQKNNCYFASSSSYSSKDEDRVCHLFQLKPRLTGRQGVMNDSNIKTVSNIGAAREVNERHDV